MISFKSFVNAIHDAILHASDELMEKNTGLLDKYFVNKEGTAGTNPNSESSSDSDSKDSSSSGVSSRAFDSRVFDEVDLAGVLTPKTVLVEYPHFDAEGKVSTSEIHVPLITLVPLTMSQIEKATLKANFEMEIVDGELQLNFTDRTRAPLGKRSKTTRGQLEITIAPGETAEGLRLLVEGYENVLKNQISK